VRIRNLAWLSFVLLGIASAAAGQDGLRMPGRAGSGIDPSFAGGWLSPERDRFGYAQYHWRDAIGFAPTQRMQWSYAFGQHSSFGMSVSNGRDFIAEPVFGADARQYGLVGRYSLAPDWSLSAETVSREPGSLFRLNDLRIGLRRSF
jgi:hypothetical protein